MENENAINTPFRQCIIKLNNGSEKAFDELATVLQGDWFEKGSKPYQFQWYLEEMLCGRDMSQELCDGFTVFVNSIVASRITFEIAATGVGSLDDKKGLDNFLIHFGKQGEKSKKGLNP